MCVDMCTRAYECVVRGHKVSVPPRARERRGVKIEDRAGCTGGDRGASSQRQSEHTHTYTEGEREKLQHTAKHQG